jgi:hypothetical protein
MPTLGEVLNDGKVWDALPLADRKEIVAQTNIRRRHMAPLKSWAALSNAEQEALCAVDWNKALAPPMRCDRCEAAMINGVFCHETGCPNSRKTWLPERGEWVLFLECFYCGCDVEKGEYCRCCPETGAEDE